jgi:hypothetical protein
MARGTVGRVSSRTMRIADGSKDTWNEAARCQIKFPQKAARCQEPLGVRSYFLGESLGVMKTFTTS